MLVSLGGVRGLSHCCRVPEQDTQGLNNVFWTTSQNPDDRVLREKWITFGVVWGHDLASTLKMLAPAPCHTQGGACVPSLQLLL